MTLASTEAASSVPLEISKTVDGHLVARVGGVWLEDPEDPVASARVFMTREQAKGVELVVLVGGGTGHRVTRLRELGVRHVVVHEPLAALRAQIRGPLAPIFRGSLLTSTPKELAAAVRQTVARPEGTRLVTSAGYAKLFPDLLAACAEPVRQGLAAAREAFETGRHRASLGTEQLAANVHRLPGKVKVGALAATRPLEGKPAFIVAAGPSLDGNAALVAEAQRRGPVFAVNTAARAIEHLGARVDVLVALEPLPLGDQLSVSARAILCDVSSHPSTLEASLGATLVSFGAKRGEHLEALFGLPAFPTEGNVATYAVRAALNLGADPVVLLGQDCAFPEGRMYASHCDRDMWRARVLGDEVHLDVDERLWRLFTDHAIPELRRDRLVRMPAWGGGDATVASIPMFARIAETLVVMARRSPGARLINATEGGAHLRGWEDRALADVLAELPEGPHGLHEAIAAAPRFSAEEVRAVEGTLRRELKALTREAERALLARGRTRPEALARTRRAAAASPLVQAHALRALMALEREGARDREKRSARVYRRSARTLLDLLGDARPGTRPGRSAHQKRA